MRGKTNERFLVIVPKIWACPWKCQGQFSAFWWAPRLLDAVLAVDFFSYRASAEVGGSETVVIKTGSHFPILNENDTLLNAIIDLASVLFPHLEARVPLEAFRGLGKNLLGDTQVFPVQVLSIGHAEKSFQRKSSHSLKAGI